MPSYEECQEIFHQAGISIDNINYIIRKSSIKKVGTKLSPVVPYALIPAGLATGNSDLALSLFEAGFIGGLLSTITIAGMGTMSVNEDTQIKINDEFNKIDIDMIQSCVKPEDDELIERLRYDKNYAIANLLPGELPFINRFGTTKNRLLLVDSDLTELALRNGY